MKVSDVKIGKRRRKSMGDIDSLVSSIQEVGLLHPIVVDGDDNLIVGYRRLEAFKKLERVEIPHRTVSTLVDALVTIAERDENTCREEYTPEEKLSLAEALEKIEKREAKERQSVGGKTAGRSRPKIGSGKLPEPKGKSGSQTRDTVAKSVGWSGKTLDKAREVAQAAKNDPKAYGDLLNRMNKTGKVDPAYKEYRKRKKNVETQAAAKKIKSSSDSYKLIHGDIRMVEIGHESVDVIITDPPYPEEYISLYGILSEKAHQWLKPGGSLIVMVGQSYFPQVLSELVKHMKYQWLVAYLTPGGQSVQLWDRNVNTFWKPVIWLTKGEYSGEWVGDVCSSKTNDNDKRFDGWGQSESGMADIVTRFSKPEDTILDPFCGGGTTGVAALRLGRKFIGVDVNQEDINTCKVRLNNATKAS